MAAYPDIGAYQQGGPDIGALQSQFAGPQTIDPDSILTAESWGSALVGFEQTISPGSILSGESWSSDTLISREQEIFPGFIPSAESWGTPIVAGPVNPDSIESAESWGTPTLNVEQAVSPGTIASTESWGSVDVALVETVSPDSILSAESWGTAVLSIVNRPVFPDSIPSAEDWGDVEVNGGTLALQVFVGNYDRTRWHHRGTLRVRSQTRGRWSGSIQFQNVPDGHMELLDTDDDWHPLRGQTILIKEFQEILFRGCIRSIVASRPMSTNFVLYDCVLADKGSICDHRVVTRSYPGSADGGEVWTIAAMVNDVIANYLNNEGISLGSDLTAEGNLDVATPSMVSVTQIFDLVTTLTGLEWFVDHLQKLRFVEPDSAGLCPFEITETSNNWRNLRVEETDVDFRTHQYVVSNRRISPTVGATPSIVESYTLEDYGTGHVGYPDNMGYQRKAVEQYGFPPYTIFVNFPIQTVLSVTVNSVDVPFADYADAVEGDLFGTWFYQAGAAYIDASPYNDPGDVVEITYTPWSAIPATVADTDLFVISVPPGAPAGEQFGTCGSGRYDRVEQVNDVSTREGMNAIAEGLRSMLGVIPRNATVEVDMLGAEVGQRIYGDVPRQLWPDEHMFITGIEWTEESSGMDLGQGTMGRTVITATNRPGVGNWIKRWERLYRLTQHPQPLVRIQPLTAHFTGTVRAGNNITTPGKVPETGQLVRIIAKFKDAPVDQDLVLTILRNGVSILTSAKLVIPEGETGDVVLEEFAEAFLYLAKDDTITVNASYNILGPSPVGAKQGTVQLQVLI